MINRGDIWSFSSQKSAGDVSDTNLLKIYRVGSLHLLTRPIALVISLSVEEEGASRGPRRSMGLAKWVVASNEGDPVLETYVRKGRTYVKSVRARVLV